MEKIKGYKVFNPDFTCRGFQYAENKLFTHKGEIAMCDSGLHFCESAADCFSYYSFNPENIVCEVESRGKFIRNDDDSKVVADKLFVGKKLSWGEVLNIVNTGKGNTGLRNSGNCNSGNCNSGNCNSGNRNSGNWNSGYRNSGYRNSGAFCTDDNPKVFLFDKPTKMKVREWEESEAVSIMRQR